MRSVEEIYKDLLSAFAGRAGFTPEAGCDLAVRLWAAAAELQALEIQADWVLDQSFPQTAQGVWLDRHGAMRGLKRLPAARAAGVLRFCVETAPAMDAAIPAGTVCMTAEEVRFRTTEEGALPAGALYADVPAEALVAGTGGNAVPGAVRFLTACPVAVTSVTNPEAFTGGCEEEDDETFRARILESYRRLPNGANTAWYETTAMGYPGVTAAKAVGRAEGPGTVNVYVAGENGLPGEALLRGLAEEFREKREIAVQVKVLAPEVRRVNVSAAVVPKEGEDKEAVLESVRRAVADFFGGRMLGRPVRLAELGNRLYALEGVENYRFTAPEADVPADSTVLPVLGTLEVTELREAENV